MCARAFIIKIFSNNSLTIYSSTYILYKYNRKTFLNIIIIDFLCMLDTPMVYKYDQFFMFFISFLPRYTAFWGHLYMEALATRVCL